MGYWLITRNGNDFTSRFPLAAAAVASLPANSFLVDGEAIVTNAKGSFARRGRETLRYCFREIQ
jgi:ATP-dependent DNA ligase